MSLEDYLNSLVQKGYLRKEDIGFDQVKALIKSAERNLIASKKNLLIDEETCYAMAYTAMLKVARALLYLQGFRPDDGQQHKTTVEAASKILGSDFNILVEKFDQMRKKRNKFTYEPLLPLSKEEANNAFRTAEEFFDKVENYLQKVDPQKKLFE